MLNQKIYKQLVHGLEQQLWYLGLDTLDPKNNLLVQYGFKRYRTEGHGGSSRYAMQWKGRTLDLHSFCVGLYGNKKPGFLYVRAHDKAYTYRGRKPPLPGRYGETFLVRPTTAKTKKTFLEASAEFLEWVDEYERWVEKKFGKGYRLRCYREYHLKWLSPAKARKWFGVYRTLTSGDKTLLQKLSNIH